MYNWTLTGKGHCWILQRNWKAKTSSTSLNLRWGWIIEVELLHYFYSVLFWLWKIWKKQLKLNLCLYFYKFFKYVVFKCKLITNIWISMNTQILASEIEVKFKLTIWLKQHVESDRLIRHWLSWSTTLKDLNDILFLPALLLSFQMLTIIFLCLQGCARSVGYEHC